MGKPIFRSSSAGFIDRNRGFVDMVQGHMAMDIEVALKSRAGMPVKTGGMKTETRHFRGANGGFRVEIDKAYAAYQERGVRADGSHRVQNYTTSGTSKGFFARAIDMVIRNKDTYIQEARRAMNL